MWLWGQGLTVNFGNAGSTNAPLIGGNLANPWGNFRPAKKNYGGVLRVSNSRLVGTGLHLLS